MARLTWQDVNVPNMDIRGLAIAGQTVMGGFDRLAAMLNQRYAVQREDQTNAAIAQQLAITDPTQLRGPVDIASFGKNVDAARVLEARNSQRRGLILELDANEDLLNKQAAAAFGEQYGPMLEAARGGDRAALAAIRTTMEADPLAKRYLAQVAPDLFNAQVGGEEFREERRKTDIDNAEDQEQLAISRGNLALNARQVSLEESRRSRTLEGMRVGATLAEQAAIVNPADARRWLLNNETYRNLPEEAKVAAMASFGEQQAVWAKPDSETMINAAPTIGAVGRLTADLEAAANRRESGVANDPMLAAIRAADANPGVTSRDLITKMDQYSTFISEGTINSQIGRIREQVKEKTGREPSIADISAAIDQFGMNNNWFYNHDEVVNNVAGMMERRGQGYTANADIDRANARREPERLSLQLEEAARQYAILRAKSDAGNATISDESQLEVLRKRVLELQAKAEELR